MVKYRVLWLTTVRQRPTQYTADKNVPCGTRSIIPGKMILQASLGTKTAGVYCAFLCTERLEVLIFSLDRRLLQRLLPSAVHKVCLTASAPPFDNCGQLECTSPASGEFWSIRTRTSQIIEAFFNRFFVIKSSCLSQQFSSSSKRWERLDPAPYVRIMQLIDHKVD